MPEMLEELQVSTAVQLLIVIINNNRTLTNKNWILDAKIAFQLFQHGVKISHKIFVHTEENSDAALLGAMKTATGCRVTNIKNYMKGITLKTSIINIQGIYTERNSWSMITNKY